MGKVQSNTAETGVIERNLQIQARALNVWLGDAQILHEIAFLLPPTRVGLIGPNGSGKTTLLRAIGGLIPYRGSIAIEEKEVRDWKPRQLARKLAFVRQQHLLEFDFLVRDFVALGRTPHKRLLDPYDRTDQKLVDEALEAVEMRDFGHRVMNTLSGGEQQRIFLAQAMVQEADILLLDEPTAHLDVRYQFELMHRMTALADSGKMVVAVYHDLALAARFADRLLVLNHGRLVADGPPAEVLTGELIAEVFRMRADVTTGHDGHPLIHYHAPVDFS